MLRRLLAGVSLSLAMALATTALVVAAPGRPAVADAAMNDNRAAVKTLLRQGDDVNAAQHDGMTALHWAAFNGDVAMARMLLYAGADTSAATRIGAYTPLDVAAKNGHAGVVAALLKGGANPDLTNAHGTTPLMFAAASGDAASIEALLAAGAKVNVREDVRGETALMLAAAYDRADAIDVLLAHGADWRPTSRVLNWTELPPGDPRLPSFGRFRKKNGAKGKEPATRDRAATGDGAGAKTKRAAFNPFLRYPRLVGTQGGLTALLFAARQGYTDAVEALLAHGADVNQVDPGDHTSPLLIAIINGHYDLAEKLLAAGANPDQASVNGVTPLYAVLNCEWSPKADYPQPTAYKQQKTSYLTLMTDLLARGADPNARLKEKVWYSGYNFDQSGLDETGATPFWRAAWADDVPAMKLLVAHGANPDIATVTPKPRRRFFASAPRKDYSGLPPRKVGSPDITPLLAASGEAYGTSFTANQHRFAPTGMLAAVQYLVDVLHANVNARDAAGNTPLHNAASVGNNAMILFLVSRGANIHAINRNGQTIADMANGPFQRVSPFPKTIALVEQLGGKLMHKCVSCGG